MKSLTRVCTLFLSLILFPFYSFGDVILVGNYLPYKENNCLMVGCAPNSTYTLYQQSYRSSAFGGQFLVEDIAFFRALPGNMDTATYRLSFYLSEIAPENLTNTPDLNRGAKLSDFGVFSVGGVMPEELHFAGNSFLYDPAMGNLLLNIELLSGTPGDLFALGYFQAEDNTRGFYRGYGNESFLEVDSVGLITQFSGESIGPIPEPGSLMLMALGAAGLMTVCRARRPPSRH